MFESVMELTQEQVQWLDECAEGTWALNPQTGLVDVKGGFNCSQQSLTDFKGVRFGVVDGYFYCENNALTSLVGAPLKVGDDFYCDHNALTSLVGAPQSVGENFRCNHNALTSLEGAPQRIRGTFACHINALTSLVGAPLKVGKDFYCSYNALTSLVGAPLDYVKYFNCEHNALTSLMGAPQRVGEGFYCSYNALTSLVGAPKRARCGLSCVNNPVSEKTLKAIFTKMKKDTSYLAAVESLWSKIPQDDQVLLYADDFKWVTPEQSRGIVALRAYQDLRGML